MLTFLNLERVANAFVAKRQQTMTAYIKHKLETHATDVLNKSYNQWTDDDVIVG